LTMIFKVVAAREAQTRYYLLSHSCEERLGVPFNILRHVDLLSLAQHHGR